MRDFHTVPLRAPARLDAAFALVCICLLALVGCGPFQQAGNKSNTQTASTATPGGSLDNSTPSGAVSTFDPSTAIHAITEWNLQVQSNRIFDGQQARSVQDSGWATDNFHMSDHLGYGFSQLQDPITHTAVAPAVVGSIEYVFFVTDSTNAKHYGLLLGTADQTGHAVTFVLWLDAQPLTHIVQLFSAPVAEPFDWGLANYSTGVQYTESSEAALAAGLASGGVLHHTIVIWFDLAPTVSSSSAKGGTTSLSPAQVQNDKVIEALNSPGAAALPAGVFGSAPSPNYKVTTSDGATNPLNIILPSSPTPHF